MLITDTAYSAYRGIKIRGSYYVPNILTYTAVRISTEAEDIIRSNLSQMAERVRPTTTMLASDATH